MKFQAPTLVNGMPNAGCNTSYGNQRHGSVLFDTLCRKRLSRARLISSFLVGTSIAIAATPTLSYQMMSYIPTFHPFLPDCRNGTARVAHHMMSMQGLFCAIRLQSKFNLRPPDLNELEMIRSSRFCANGGPGPLEVSICYRSFPQVLGSFQLSRSQSNRGEHKFRGLERFGPLGRQGSCGPGFV